MNDNRAPRYWPYLFVFGALCLIAWLVGDLVSWDRNWLAGWVGALAIGFYLIGRLAAAF